MNKASKDIREENGGGGNIDNDDNQVLGSELDENMSPSVPALSIGRNEGIDGKRSDEGGIMKTEDQFTNKDAQDIGRIQTNSNEAKVEFDKSLEALSEPHEIVEYDKADERNNTESSMIVEIIRTGPIHEGKNSNKNDDDNGDDDDDDDASTLAGEILRVEEESPLETANPMTDIAREVEERMNAATPSAQQEAAVDGYTDAITPGSATTSRRRQQAVRRLRQKAAIEGHVGGRRVPSHVEAATIIQSAWRSKAVRIDRRRLDFFARELQRRVRGNMERRRVAESASRLKELRKQENTRIERLKRIRSKERELVLLRSLPADQFLSVDRVRREHSARLLQRAWRLSRGASYTIAAPSAGTPQAQEDPLAREIEALFKKVTSMLPQQEQTPAPMKIEMDTYGLAQLHRRVKDAASRRLKGISGGDVRDANDVALPNDLDLLSTKRHPLLARSQIFNTEKKYKIGGARKIYQEMLQIQHIANVYLEEYAMRRHELVRAQEDRLRALGHCRSMIKQLLEPLSLSKAHEILVRQSSVEVLNNDKASETSNNVNEEWMQFIPREGLKDSVAAHLRTASAMESITKKSDSSKQPKWSVVATPHDVTGPPIDITTLPSVQYDFLLNSIPFDHFNSKDDKEESLWWVAYAAQKTRFSSEEDTKSDSESPSLRGGWTTEGQPHGNESQRTAQQLLGQVKGEELLQKVMADVMTLPDRQKVLGKILDAIDVKEKRQAYALRDDILRRIVAKNGRSIHQDESEHSRRQRETACCRIQAFVRGSLCRAKVKAQKAEQRVLAALTVLISELSAPAGKFKSKSQSYNHESIFAKLKDSLHNPMKSKGLFGGKVTESSTNLKNTENNSSVTRMVGVSQSTSIAPSLSPHGKVSFQDANRKDTQVVDLLRSSEGTNNLITLDETMHLSDPDPDIESNYDPLSYVSSPSMRDEESVVLGLDSPVARWKPGGSF